MRLIMTRQMAGVRILAGAICGILISVVPDVSLAGAERQRKPSLAQNEVRELDRIGLKAFDAVVAKDISGLLKLIDPNGIRWGADGVKSYAEIEEDLRSGKGPLFCRLFGCVNSTMTPVRAYFLQVKRSHLKITVRQTFEEFASLGMKYVRVSYSWPGVPQSFIDSYDSLEFRWEESRGWLCESLFED